jgi:hypothetical protein
MSQQEPEVPEQVDGDPVVDVQEASQPLTPDEVKQAQEADAEQP